MPEPQASIHEALLYPGRSYPHTHPDRLATLAVLHGMQPAPVDRCRVLELGCGRGWNLLPMAYGLPESAFAGIDLAGRPIALGREAAEALGLKNVTLLQQDLMDVSADLGTFDYVIAHGVYTWVPPAVRDRVLAICRAHLAPHGVAYVSYMTYPGAYVPRMMREMMLFHMRHFEGLPAQIAQARAMLRLALEAQPEEGAYRRLLEEAVERIGRYPDEYLIHDDLAESYTPCYFQQFAEHAARHGLQYLAEADFFEMQTGRFPEHVVEGLMQVGGDPILKEQYLDLLKGRQFRRTLLCHREVRLERDVGPERVRGLYAVAPVRLLPPDPDRAASGMERFEGLPGSFAETDELPFKAALRLLGERWPRYVAFEELVEGARSGPGEEAASEASGEDQAVRIAKMLLELYGANFLSLHVHCPRFVHEAGERPVAGPPARLQVRTSPYVSTLAHESVRLQDPVSHALLPLLDGTRDRAGLQDALVEMAEAGTLTVHRDGEPVTDRHEVAAALGNVLEEALARLARQRLLLA